jgi:hypothetical protein
MSRAVLIFILIITSMESMVFGQSQSKDHQNVLRSVEALRLLMVTPDAEKLSDIVADELSYGHSNGRVEDKQSFIATLTSGDSDFVSLLFSNINTKLIGDVALVRHELQAETNDKGKGPASIKLGILLVWKKMKGDWKLIGRQAYKL